MTAQDAAIAAQAAEEGGGNGGSQNIPAHTIRADVAPPPHQRLRIADPPVAAAAPPSRIDPLPLAGSAAGDPQILSFYAEPALVTVGEIARLCFNVRNADSASIEYVGAVSVGGPACVNVAPHETQTYTLEVVGNYKLYRAYASVAVSQPNAGLSQHLGSGSASTYARRLTQQ